MPGVSIELTMPEIIAATQAAIARVANAPYQLKGDAAAANRGRGDIDAWTAIKTQTLAAAAEIATAKKLGCYWSASFGPGNCDLEHWGRQIDVKHTIHSNGRLHVYQGSLHSDWTYVLVTGELPTLTVVGWIDGIDIERVGEIRQLTKTRPPSHVVEQHHLTAFTERK